MRQVFYHLLSWQSKCLKLEKVRTPHISFPWWKGTSDPVQVGQWDVGVISLLKNPKQKAPKASRALRQERAQNSTRYCPRVEMWLLDFLFILSTRRSQQNQKPDSSHGACDAPGFSLSFWHIYLCWWCPCWSKRLSRRRVSVPALRALPQRHTGKIAQAHHSFYLSVSGSIHLEPDGFYWRVTSLRMTKLSIRRWYDQCLMQRHGLLGSSILPYGNLAQI